MPASARSPHPGISARHVPVSHADPCNPTNDAGNDDDDDDEFERGGEKCWHCVSPSLMVLPLPALLLLLLRLLPTLLPSLSLLP